MSTEALIAPERGRRYPLKVVRFARRLYEDGRTIAEVRAALARQGYYPCHKSVVHWCEPEARDAYNLRRNHLLWPATARRRRDRPWHAKLDRMRRLREGGLSFAAIAKVAKLDFGLQLSDDQVRHILNDKMSAASVRALLEGKQVRRGRSGAVD